MNKYRLNKRYILKVIVVRILILAIFNVLYINNIYRVPYEYHFLVVIMAHTINVIGAIFIMFMPIIEYLSYSYIISDKSVEIKCGIIFRKSIYIPRNNIKYVVIQKDIFDQMFRINNLKLYTTAGHRVIKAISGNKVHELWNIMEVWGA